MQEGAPGHSAHVGEAPAAGEQGRLPCVAEEDEASQRAQRVPTWVSTECQHLASGGPPATLLTLREALSHNSSAARGRPAALATPCPPPSSSAPPRSPFPSGRSGPALRGWGTVPRPSPEHEPRHALRLGRGPLSAPPPPRPRRWVRGSWRWFAVLAAGKRTGCCGGAGHGREAPATRPCGAATRRPRAMHEPAGRAHGTDAPAPQSPPNGDYAAAAARTAVAAARDRHVPSKRAAEARVALAFPGREWAASPGAEPAGPPQPRGH